MEASYNFVYLKNKTYNSFLDKNVQELLMKWSMKGNLRVQTYSFNEPFQPYQKNALANAFFKDSIVTSTLQGEFGPVGCTANTVDIEHIPSSITSMSFFDPITKPQNGIVRGNGMLVKCLDYSTDKFVIADELRRMLLDSDSDSYNLFSMSDRKQFLFRLFKHLCIGGMWCQYEDSIQEYLNTTKMLYKDLISVQRDAATTKGLCISSMILQVVARDTGGIPYFPCNPDNFQNFAYLIVNPVARHFFANVKSYKVTPYALYIILIIQEQEFEKGIMYSTLGMDYINSFAIQHIHVNHRTLGANKK